MSGRSLLLLSLLVACAKGAPPAASRDRAADERAVRKTLDDWYEAMYANDSARIVAPLTREFLLLEDTLPLSGVELVARLKSDNGGAKWKANFSDFKTRIEGDVAWTTLRNHEDIEAPGNKKCTADFLETIVFVRAGEGWKIDRYHAAALHPMACAP
jgi:ketosteroid isomerase-like protein